MMNNRDLQRKLDRISASRLSRIGEGIPRHVALSDIKSITLRNKFKRMGLEGSHIDNALKMVDEIGFQKILNNQPLGSKFATIPQSKKKPAVWNG
jgi:hypothetical protein